MTQDVPSPDSSNVPDANGERNTRPPAGSRKRKLPPRNKWPHYSDADKTTIATYLAAWRVHMEEGVRRADQLLALDPTELGSINQKRYWVDCVRCCDFLMARLEYRQQHLAIAEFIDKHGVMPE